MKNIDQIDIVRCIMSPDDFIFVDGTREAGLGIGVVVTSDTDPLAVDIDPIVILDDAGIDQLIEILMRKRSGGGR